MRMIELSPEAADDILGIWDYIARSNLPAADRIRDKLHDDIQNLARMPGLGHTRRETYAICDIVSGLSSRT
jgi:plasmid stabilization system protein ParE